MLSLNELQILKLKDNYAEYIETVKRTISSNGYSDFIEMRNASAYNFINFTNDSYYSFLSELPESHVPKSNIGYTMFVDAITLLNYKDVEWTTSQLLRARYKIMSNISNMDINITGIGNLKFIKLMSPQLFINVWSIIKSVD